MPSSFCQIAVHIVFSTKEWNPWLISLHREKLNQYISGVISNIKGETIIINGTDDHIHILCLLPKEMSIAEFVRTIKANSSKWYRREYNPKFNWQEGYAAFSVGWSNLEQVKSYIKNQQKHHQKRTGEDELEGMMAAFWKPDTLQPVN
ncbi:MAG: IS200/IS605 family transposase [Candidatus Syntrophosphaera sp.]